MAAVSKFISDFHFVFPVSFGMTEQRIAIRLPVTSYFREARYMNKKTTEDTFSPLPASSLVSRDNSNLARNLDFIRCPHLSGKTSIGMTSNWWDTAQIYIQIEI